MTVSVVAPLSLRIPCWCNSATVTIGSQQPKTAPGCAHFQLDSAPANTPIVIAFNNSIRIYTWHANGNYCICFSLPGSASAHVRSLQSGLPVDVPRIMCDNACNIVALGVDGSYTEGNERPGPNEGSIEVSKSNSKSKNERQHSLPLPPRVLFSNMS